jgi:hypothetical protein
MNSFFVPLFLCPKYWYTVAFKKGKGSLEFRLPNRHDSQAFERAKAYLGLAEKARKAYAHRFSRATKTDKMQRKAAKARKNLAPIKIHVPKSPYRTAIIREFLPTIWRQTVRRKSMGKISGTSTMGTI